MVFEIQKTAAPAGRRFKFILSLTLSQASDNALAHHGAGDLFKAGDVGTGDKVALAAVLFGGGSGVLVNVDHNVVQALVHFLKGPGQAQAVENLSG